MVRPQPQQWRVLLLRLQRLVSRSKQGERFVQYAKMGWGNVLLPHLHLIREHRGPLLCPRTRFLLDLEQFLFDILLNIVRGYVVYWQ